MLIKSTKKATDLAREGEHDGELTRPVYRGEGKKVILPFAIMHNGKQAIVPKEDPANFDSGPLRKDLELLNGADFTTKEIEEGIDPEKFVGRKCRVLVVHKRTSGRKVIAVVSVLLPLAASTSKPAPAAPPAASPQAEPPAAVQPGAT
jgi:hypothetical protein